MKKKLIYIIPSAIIALAAIISFLIFSFLPRLTYTYSKEYKGYLVSKAYGVGNEYVIPETFNGEKVVGIDVKAFYANKHIVTITFEKASNIEYIGRLAFSECSSLKNIDLSYVKEIQRNAFSEDVSLESVRLSAKNIGASAFFGCKGLNNIELNEGITSIGSQAFAYTKINNIRLPKSLNNLYIDSLKHLDNLNKIEVYQNNKLTKDSITYLDSFKNIITYIE